MVKKNLLYVFVAAMAAFMLSLVTFKEARAVPSFARQTGMDCMACHTAFPELTPFGRTFKLTGYTISKSDKPYQFPPPVAAQFLGSFTHTNKRLPNEAVPQDIHANDNWTIPQEASLFYAGKIFYKVGTFMQFTFDGVSKTFLLDHTDIRFANTTKIGGKPFVYGLTFNNNPTAQDVLNTTPAFGFPWAASDAAPTPAAAAIIDGGLEAQVGGLGIYGFWNNLIYGEVTLYRTARNGFTQPLSAGTVIDTFVDGIAPYWRLFLYHQKGKHSFAFGHYGMITHIFPEGETRGNTDVFTDIALDAQYQYLSKNHIFSAQTTWIHELQDWNGSFPLGGTSKHSTSLDTFRINFNYYYRFRYGTLGGTVAFFTTTGTRDPVLYAPDPAEGSRTGSPDSNGFILQASYLPWERTKFTVQYTIYNKFNGAGTNYDGFGRNASDNNTLYLLAWLAF